MGEKISRFLRFLSLSLVVLGPIGSSLAVGQEVTDVRLPELREELLVRADKDQAARKAAIAWVAEHGDNGIIDEASLDVEQRAAHKALWDEVARIDVENTAWLQGVVEENGWPTVSDTGHDGAGSAWLIVQHADANPAFQRQCLDLMAELPKDEVSQQDLAFLTDRVRLAEGKPQIYGSQFAVRDGEWVPMNLEDPENVDARRAEVGLPPLAEYREMLEAVQRGDLEID